MKAFDDNQAWILVKTPKNKNLSWSKWVFKLEQNEEGKIDEYKARYVAKDT